MKYTREDVIMNKAQAEKAGLKIGAECYFGDKPSEALINANNENYLRHLSEIDWECELPFKDGQHRFPWKCVILKKKEKKLVPFDFSLKEDRDTLMGKRIRTDACDMVVTTFAYWLAHGWQIQIDSENGFSGEYVLENFVFADGPNEGKPVGKEVEE